MYESIINKIDEIDKTDNISKLTDIIDEIKNGGFSFISNPDAFSDENVEMSNIIAYLLAAGFLSGVVLGGGKNKSLKFKHIKKNKTIKSRFNKKGGFNIDKDDIVILKNIAFNIVKEIIKQTYIINELNQKLNNKDSLTEIEKFIDLCEKLFNETKKIFNITDNITMGQIKLEADKSIFSDDQNTGKNSD